jgi:hypothetical protein
MHVNYVTCCKRDHKLSLPSKSESPDIKLTMMIKNLTFSRLRWECVSLKKNGSAIQITEGKSKAARRLLPLIPEVCRVLQARWESQGCRTEGWVFPSASESGHLEEGSAKIQQGDTVEKLQAVKDAFDTMEEVGVPRKLAGFCRDKHGPPNGLPPVSREGFLRRSEGV